LHAGPCPTCDGTKKVPCPLCHPNEAKAAAAKAAQKATTNPFVADKTDKTDKPDKATAAKTPPAASDALATPEALLKYLQTGGPPSPQKDKAAWAKLTTLQQDAALDKYNKAQAAWQNSAEFKGKPISWTMSLSDVSAAPRGDGYILKTVSAKGIMVPISLPASAKDDLMSWKKDDRIIVTGKIDDYSLGVVSLLGVDTSDGTLSVSIADANATLAPK
jgi:hypothetical protein